MQIGFAIESCLETRRFVPIIVAIQRLLKARLENESFGPGLNRLAIGISLPSRAGQRYKPIRPYRFRRRVRMPDNGEVLQNVASFDVKVDVDLLTQAPAEQATNMLCAAIRRSLDVLDAHRKDFPEVDVQALRRSIEECLEVAERDSTPGGHLEPDGRDP